MKYLMNLQKTDFRSTFEMNVKKICLDSGVDNISEVNISDIIYAPVPTEHLWRIPVLTELLELKAGRLESDMDIEDIQASIRDLTVS